MSKAKPLLQDQVESQLQLVLKRSKYRGEFSRMHIHEQYKGGEWLQRRIGLADLYDLVDEVEKATNKFLWSRVAIYANILVIASAFVLFGVGISNHYYLDKENNDKNDDIIKQLTTGVINFWDLSWPFFVSLLFLPLTSFSLFLINRIILSFNMNKIAQILRDENVKNYESRNLFWEIGVRCKFLKLALIVERNSTDFESLQNNTDKTQENLKNFKRNNTTDKMIGFQDPNDVINQVIESNYIKKIPDQPLELNPNLNTFEQSSRKQIVEIKCNHCEKDIKIDQNYNVQK